MANVTPLLLMQLLADLERQEAYRKFAYPDPGSLLAIKYRSQPWGFKPAREILNFIGQPDTKGTPWTVGIGYTIGVTPDSTMTLEMARQKCKEHVLREVVPGLERYYPQWKTQPFAVQTVLLNMAYNMGAVKLSKFTNTLKFITAGDYAAAAKNLEKSLWYKQVGVRAKELVERIRTQSIDPRFKVNA